MHLTETFITEYGGKYLRNIGEKFITRKLTEQSCSILIKFLINSFHLHLTSIYNSSNAYVQNK